MPVCECECVSELVNCFVGCWECGIMLARILDSVPEHFTLKKPVLHLQIQLISPNDVKSLGNYTRVVSWRAGSDRPQSGLALYQLSNPTWTPGSSYLAFPSVPHTTGAIPSFVPLPAQHPRTEMFTLLFTTDLILCDVMLRSLLASCM